MNPPQFLQKPPTSPLLQTEIPRPKNSPWSDFVLLIILAAGLRIPGITRPLAGDEATSFWEHGSSSWISLLARYNGPNQHTLFSVLSNLSMHLFGENELAFRLPVFVAGVLSVPLTYFLGCLLFKSRITPAIAAILLALSPVHIQWSQQGRGYALSLFLAIVMVCCIFKLLEKETSEPWFIGFIFAGLGLVLTLPSNAYFLVGCGLAYLVAWSTDLRKDPLSGLWNRCQKLVPLIILTLLAAGYFLVILDDLEQGLETFRRYGKLYLDLESLDISSARLLELVNYLIPLGWWGYLLVAIGYWKLGRNQKISFFCLFGAPLILILISGILGPPRVYIYWLPFILLLAGHGLVEISIPIRDQISKGSRYLLSCLAGMTLLIVPGFALDEYYHNLSRPIFSTMNDARQALSFIEQETTPNQLIVFPFNDRTLRHYIEEPVAQKMLNIINKGQLDQITLIGQKNLPLTHIPQVVGFPTTWFPDRLTHQFKDLGDLRIYNFKVKSLPLFKFEKDPYFPSRFGVLPDPRLTYEANTIHKAVGEESLVIRKTIKTQIFLHTPLKQFVHVEDDQGFLLYAYAGRLGQTSEMGLMGIEKTRSPVFLNYHFGVFREEDQQLIWNPIHPFYLFRNDPDPTTFKWQIIFVLVPLRTGDHALQEAIIIKEKTSYFDGVQYFVLYP